MSRSLSTLPPITTINWAKEAHVLDRFILDVLTTLRDETAAIWYPVTVYNLRLIQAARWRLWRNGCALICRTDVRTDRFLIRANLGALSWRRAWAHEAAKRAKLGTVTSMQGARARARLKRRAA